MLATPALHPMPAAPPLTRRPRWELLAVAGAVAVALLPIVLRHAAWLWQRPHYQFFPFVPVGAGVLAYARLRNVSVWRPGSEAIVAIGLGMGWALLLSADVLGSTWLGCVAGMALTLILVYAAGGRTACREALPAWALLWLIVPPPLDLDRLLVFKLQDLATAWSSAVLDVFGVFHVRAGNVIEVDGKKMMVEQACSGVNSLFSLLACTLFWVFLTRQGWVRGSLLAAASIGWVLMANVARVSGVVLLESRWGIDVATGWRHEVFGLLLFGAAVGLLLSTDQLFLFLTRSTTAGVAGRSTREVPVEFSLAELEDQRGLRRVAAVGVPAFVIVAASSWILNGPDFESSLASAPAAIPDRDWLPKKVGSWEQTDFATQTREAFSFYGEKSFMWVYGSGRQTALVSLDLPFPSWHDLTWCYTGRGWHIDSQSVRSDMGVDGGLLEVRMSQSAHRYGYLLFAEFGRRGKTLIARPGGMEASFFRHQAGIQRVQSWFGLAPEPVVDPSGPVYQFQSFREGSDRLTAEDEAAIGVLAARAGNAVREALNAR